MHTRTDSARIVENLAVVNELQESCDAEMKLGLQSRFDRLNLHEIK